MLYDSQHIEPLVHDELESVRALRRTLHKMPEPGLEEYKTSSFIKEQLNSWGIPWESCVGTGIVAFLASEHPDAQGTVAFRADMDALSVTEETQHDFKSQSEGFMHACGHDGHMTIVMTLAKLLKAQTKQLKHHVLFVFQPAEEGPGGAKQIVDAGILQKYGVTAIYGLHLYPEVREGVFAYKAGPLMAMTGEFDITITGQSGHGAIPHKALDAIVIASELVVQLQNIVSRFIDPIQPAVLTVGRMICGERRNIIAKTAVLEGTLRAFDQQVFYKMRSKMTDYIEGLKVAYGCEIELDFREMYPPVVNDAELCKGFKAVNGDAFEIEAIEPQMIAEDFSEYQQVVPGLFVFLGIRNETKGHVFPLHNSKFNFDEAVLLNGIQAFCNLVVMK